MSNNYLNNDVSIENIKFVILFGLGFCFLSLSISCLFAFLDFYIILFLFYAFLFYVLSLFTFDFALNGGILI